MHLIQTQQSTPYSLKHALWCCGDAIFADNGLRQLHEAFVSTEENALHCEAHAKTTALKCYVMSILKTPTEGESFLSAWALWCDWVETQGSFFYGALSKVALSKEAAPSSPTICFLTRAWKRNGLVPQKWLDDRWWYMMFLIHPVIPVSSKEV